MQFLPFRDETSLRMYEEKPDEGFSLKAVLLFKRR